MIKNEYTLKVDLKRKQTAIVPTFVQHDSAVLIFKIYDNGKPFDLTTFTRAEVTHKRKDGQVVIGLANIEKVDGQFLVKYVYMGSEMSVEGFVDTSLTLFSGDRRVSIQPFEISIVADIRNAIGATEEYGVFQELVKSVKDLVDKANDAAAQIPYAKEQGDYAKAETVKMLIVKAQIEASEVTRIANENTRKSDESNRNTNEATRKANEVIRISNESARVTAEDTRKASEATRLADEDIRKTNETARLSKEASRVTVETDRVAKESVRTTAEDTRLTDEAIRKTNETDRIAKETIRKASEVDRVNTETARVAKESSRITSETTREQNEASRITQETDRQTNTQTAIIGANTARDNAQLAADNLGNAKAHDMFAQYKKNNVVTYNGSSFMAIRDNIGKIPIGDTDDLDWRIIARKGDDGNGVVVLYRDTFVATANQTVFTLSHSYDQLQNRIYLVIGGVPQFSPESFMETSSTKVTLHSGVPVGTTVVANYFGNAPAIINDLQLQIDSLNDIVQHMDFVAIRLAGDHAKTHGDVAKQAAIDANLARDNAILATTNTTTATSLAETAATNADTATANAVIATDNANTAADNANNAAEVAGTHTGDMTVHVTPQDKTTWNNKETPDGAQDKATTAETNAKSYTDNKVASLVGSAPETLDTLNELATALGNDPNFATSIATQIGAKVDKVVGKGLSTEDFTSTEKTKLTGVEVGANKYTHPTTHSPSIIVQDASNRFMTDNEKTKLTGIETGANKYTHPANHPASIIVQDSSNRMLSDAKIAELEAKETPTGSQTKADATLALAKTYTDSKIELGVITVSNTIPVNTAGFWLDTSVE